jgi:hypothetical protein
MEPYDQSTRNLIVQERVEQLVRDGRGVPRDRRNPRGRFDLRELLGNRARRRARSAYPARG